MKILENQTELSYLVGIIEIFSVHQKVDDAFDHEQGCPSGFVRLSNYLRGIGRCASGEITLSRLMDSFEINHAELTGYKNKYKYSNIPDIQAILIYLIDGALNCNSVIGSTATEEEINAFVIELFNFVRNVEKYLPDEMVSRIHKEFYKNILEEKQKSSFLEIRKNARFIAQGSRDDRTTGFSLFALLPSELNVEIAQLTGNSEVHDRNESEKVAFQHFSRPQ